jgi:arabinofuranosyltransferase
LAVALSSLFWVSSAGYFIDDAFISFRYADNIAETGRPAFNPNEREPVGYSNPLYVAVLAIAKTLAPALRLEIVSRLLAFGALALLLQAAIRLFAPTRRRSAAPALVALMVSVTLFPYLPSNIFSGLETALVTLATFVLLVKVHWPRVVGEVTTGAALASLCALRSDGPVLVLPFIVYFLATAPRGKRRSLVTIIAFALVPYAALLLAQVVSTGYWLPLSFYQKSTTFSPRTALSYVSFVVLCVLPLAVATASRRTLRFYSFCGAYALALSIFYARFAPWMFYRYMFPCALAIFLISFALLARRSRRAGPRLLAVIATYSLIAFPPHALAGYSWISGYRVAMSIPRQIAAALESTQLPIDQRTFASPDAGLVPYLTKWHFLDLLGLTTADLRHESPAAAILRERPSVVVLSNSNPHDSGEWPRLRAAIPPGWRLVNHVPFTNAYWWHSVDYGLSIYVREDLVDVLGPPLKSVAVDVEREMGSQTLVYRALRRMSMVGTP